MNTDLFRSNPYLKFGLLLLVLLGFGGLIWWSADILAPFVVAFILAYILDPAVDWMEETLGFRRMASILILLTLVVLAFTILEYFLIEETMDFGQQIQEVLENPPEIQQWIDRLFPDFLEEYLRQLREAWRPNPFMTESRGFSWRI